ncbi:MAG TPA: penicillin-binding protein 1C [Chryseosolibacter sp.]|nr:penicillin-binding protein 1C [Chryseosolibacter sp.]
MINRKLIRPIFHLKTRTKVLAVVVISCCIAYAFSLPAGIFDKPYSTVVVANDGQLLSASIARDGQWRFPQSDTVPRKFSTALITFEDKRFYYHPGVDIFSLGRALIQNVREGKVVSGGSTITMQVIRLSRKAERRNILEKIKEIILATRLEFRYSKEEILSLYTSHAPFGGNVVGLEAACWRYFGRDPRQLSWAEAALLAVLPNSPSLMHPGKNRAILKKKRDRLLDKLFEAGEIDALTCSLSKEEPIPEKPQGLPSLARHLLARIRNEGREGEKIVSTIDFNLQQRVEARLQGHHERLKANQIYNGAVLILDVKTGKVLAYAGNVRPGSSARGQDVDIITAPRSTGSILKPFLFAASLDEGLILPQTLLPDIPVLMNGFSPENFSKEFDGAVHASSALIRSLNIPSVLLLRDYRYEKFYTLLKNTGLTSLRQPADHYGLSLILGGAEGTLWDITGMYASLARTVNNYFEHPGKERYARKDFHGPFYTYDSLFTSALSLPSGPEREATSWLSASSIYLTFESLKELYRPVEQSGWKYFSSSAKIAWKTGTSFGLRDGWALGVTPEYAVGVWIGNADGEGRPGLTGTNAAAPLLFDVFSLLPVKRWFNAPLSEMRQVATCRRSGQRASRHCDETDTTWVTKRGLETMPCAHHKTIHLSRDGKFQVHSACAEIALMQHVSWFVLPPVQEYYYKEKNISYKPLPPFRSDCQSASSSVRSMDLVYPKPNARIIIPRDFDGKPGSSIFELAHRDQKAEVFWHLDGAFIGTTKGVHRLALNPPEGKHILTVVDANGQSLEEHFTVISTL